MGRGCVREPGWEATGQLPSGEKNTGGREATSTDAGRQVQMPVLTGPASERGRAGIRVSPQGWPGAYGVASRAWGPEAETAGAGGRTAMRSGQHTLVSFSFLLMLKSILH